MWQTHAPCAHPAIGSPGRGKSEAAEADPDNHFAQNELVDSSRQLLGSHIRQKAFEGQAFWEKRSVQIITERLFH